MENLGIHAGHRQRMRSKLLNHGHAVFDTYELLEMLLYHVIPYSDTNPTAKLLLARFGGLDAVLRAPANELTEVKGVGTKVADFLSLVDRLDTIIGAELPPAEHTTLDRYEDIGDCLVDLLGDRNEYAVGILLLDNAMRPLGFEELYNIDYGLAGVRPSPFIDAAIRHSASVAVTVHTHPYGPLFHTADDRETNKVITDALVSAGIEHLDHYIVSGQQYLGTFKSTQNFFRQSTSRVMTRRNGRGRVAFFDSFAPDRTRDFDYFSKLLSYVGNGTELASSLISRYHTVENVLTASVEELSDLYNERVAFFLKLCAYNTSRRNTEKFVFGRRCSEEEIGRYFTAAYIGASVETVLMMTLDKNGRLINCNLISEGTINSAAVIPRRFLELAKRANAASVIIAHNHPFGNTTPSDYDTGFTAALSEMFANAGIPLISHYIVAGQRFNLMAGFPTMR